MEGILKISDIQSVGELNSTDGKTLAIVLRCSHPRNKGMPNYLVRITKKQFLETGGDKEKMKALAVEVLNIRLHSNHTPGLACNVRI